MSECNIEIREIIMCDPMNWTRQAYKYYFIRFEIYRKGIFNVFYIVHLLNEIHGVKHRCDKPNPKGFLKAILYYFRSTLSHFLHYFHDFNVFQK